MKKRDVKNAAMDSCFQRNHNKVRVDGGFVTKALWVSAILIMSLALLRAAEEEKSGRVFFSPNGDGIIDNATFRLSVSNPGNVASWEFIITDSQAHEVKRLSGVKAPPSVLDWNGHDEHNQLIPDGTYHYALNVVTFAGNVVKLPAQELICDRQAPVAKVSVEPAIFSGDESGTKPLAHFFLDGSDPNGIHSWLMKIKNALSGASVKSFYGKGQPQAKADWDGRTDHGEPAPDGDYEFTLAVRDRAGNTTTTEPQKVVLDRAEPLTSVEAKPSIFSPNGDAVKDITTFTIQPPPSKKVIEQWTLSLTHPKGKVIKTFEGTGEPPREVQWDGKDKAGQTAEDAPYSYQLVTVDQAGNRGVTVPKTVIVDNTPPQAVVDLKPMLLSPNGDGFGDLGALSIDVKELNGIETYALEVRNDVGDLKKTFKGEGTPDTHLQWAGQDASGGLLIDGKYTYSMVLVDRAGNKTLTPPKPMQIDTSPPVVNMAVEPKLISPNGEQKEALLSISVQDASDIEAWTLKIEDSKKKTVRKFEGAGLLTSQIAWDGRGDSKEMAPDGSYDAVFWVQDKAHNATLAPPLSVTVGAKIPDLLVKAKLPAFSPNADGVKDSDAFALSVKSFNKIRHWALQITDDSGIVMREFEGLGAAPLEIVWGGERNDKSAADDALYRYLLKVIDEAGNKNETAAQLVQIDTTRPQIDIKAQPALFSPNADGVIDETVFHLTYRDASPAGRWTITVKSENNKVVRTFTGEGDLPQTMTWNGKGDSDKPLPDGPYTYTLAAEDAVGNKSVTLDQIARLDTTPPALTLAVDPAIFAPKSDSAKNSAQFNLTSQDASNIAQWSLRFSGSKGGEVYRIKGEGKNPIEVVWDGANEKSVVFPDDTYKVRLFATDEVGNEGRSPEAVVTIDTSRPILAVAPEEELVPSLMPEITPEESGRGIVIHLAAEVLFETGKAEIRTVAYPTLDEAAGLIRKYPKRSVVVEGHTDNVPIHSEEFPSNKELSDARAQSIMRYFIDARRIEAARMTSKGYADTRPIAVNTTPEGRQKNRRVEIVILKAAEQQKTVLDTNDKSPKGGAQP